MVFKKLRKYEKEYGALFWLVAIIAGFFLIMAAPMIIMILGIIMIILIVWTGFSAIFFERYKHKYPSLEILKKRYASGDITKKQYEKMKKDLK